MRLSMVSEFVENAGSRRVFVQGAHLNPFGRLLVIFNVSRLVCPSIGVPEML